MGEVSPSAGAARSGWGSPAASLPPRAERRRRRARERAAARRALGRRLHAVGAGAGAAAALYLAVAPLLPLLARGAAAAGTPWSAPAETPWWMAAHVLLVAAWWVFGAPTVLPSLGHGALAGCGLATAAYLLTRGVPLAVAAPAAVAMAAALAAGFGVALLRLPAVPFALLTLAIAEALRRLAAARGWLEPAGRLPPAEPAVAVGAYYAVVAGVAVAVALAALVERSRTGLALAAWRQDALAARTLGVAPLPHLLLPLSLSGLLAGAGGALLVAHPAGAGAGLVLDPTLGPSLALAGLLAGDSRRWWGALLAGAACGWVRLSPTWEAAPTWARLGGEAAALAALLALRARRGAA